MSLELFNEITQSISDKSDLLNEIKSHVAGYFISETIIPEKFLDECGKYEIEIIAKMQFELDRLCGQVHEVFGNMLVENNNRIEKRVKETDLYKQFREIRGKKVT
jgi:hypothetical protein